MLRGEEDWNSRVFEDATIFCVAIGASCRCCKIPSIKPVHACLLRTGTEAHHLLLDAGQHILSKAEYFISGSAQSHFSVLPSW